MQTQMRYARNLCKRISFNHLALLLNSKQNNVILLTFGRPSLTVPLSQEYIKWHTLGAIGAVMEGLADAMDTTGEGDGKILPVVPALMAGGLGLSTLYGIGQSLETYRYWSDYYRNTGVRPRYPFRAGLYDPMRVAAGALYGSGGVYGAYNSWRGGQYKPDTSYNPYDYGMYG